MSAALGAHLPTSGWTKLPWCRSSHKVIGNLETNFMACKPALDERGQEILGDVLKHTQSPLDTLAYRALHFDWLEFLDELTNKRFLIVRSYAEGEYAYRLTLWGLDLLYTSGNEKAATLLQGCERIFEALKTHYLKNQREPVTVAELAKLCTLPPEQTQECLLYMGDNLLAWGVYASSASLDAQVKPAESILRHSDFRSVIDQMWTLWKADASTTTTVTKQDRWCARAEKIRAENPSLSQRKIADRIAREDTVNSETVRKALRKRSLS